MIALLAPVVVLASGGLAAAKDEPARIKVDGNSVNVRRWASTDTKIERTLPDRLQIGLRCYAKGQKMVGLRDQESRTWYRLSKGGYVASVYLNKGWRDPVTRKCDNNGVPTSRRAWGSVTGSNNGAVGNCTFGAYDKFKKYSGYYPDIHGNAKDTALSANLNGWTVVQDPAVNSIVVFQPGVQGANSTYGHMAWVDSIEKRSDGTYLHITEMNWKGLGITSTRVVKDVSGMSYILAPKSGTRPSSKPRSGSRTAQLALG